MELSSDFKKCCILYEVLQKNEIYKSYEKFCDTVGKKAMDFSDFKFWFYEFRDSDYDRSADIEPLTLVDMPVVLKYHILYEVLQKKPIFESYRTFCDAVGKDAMEYSDFEFWYYRFFHGNRDLDYDRSADPVPKTIMDMPVQLMHKITGNLDPVERTFLRSINHAIKTVADSFPPVFEKIEITVSSTRMQWILNNKLFACYKRGSGCIIKKPNSSKREESEECYIENGIEHLALVLKIPNIQVNHFSLEVSDETLNLNDLLPVPLNAKSVSICGRSTNQIVQSLSVMNPGHLEKINIEMENSREWHDYRRIFETDQFKHAKSVDFEKAMFFTVADLVKFSHLKSFKCHLRSENPFEDVPRIRDILSSCEELESCELDYVDALDNRAIVTFAMALGAEIPIEPLAPFERLTITHRYQIPESKQCLEFKLHDGMFYCRVNIAKLR
ncbi:hypothetical protein B9Z55_027022 [Caenorhabditis nigoni]|nr:hypothetical protein B9Z55_027022 [Caenorhabditis nigoni]